MTKVFVLAVLVVMEVFFADAANVTIDFDSYVSPTSNQLSDQFYQSSGYGLVGDFYHQNPTSGIIGGSVTSYAGDEYRATAVYQNAFLDFSQVGAKTSLTLDLFFNGQIHPLVDGATGVRSFNLGLINGSMGAFESQESSVYVQGVYSIPSAEIILVARNINDGSMTSIGLTQAPLALNTWYQIEVTFLNAGNSNVEWDIALSNKGATGMDAANVVTSAQWNWENANITDSSKLSVGFSALADGGVEKADNLKMTNMTNLVPEPSALSLLAVGLGVVLRRRRRTV